MDLTHQIHSACIKLNCKVNLGVL